MIKENQDKVIKVEYGEIPNENFCNYLDYLVNKIFKILCMKEENCTTLKSYLESLQRELIGNQELVKELKNDPNFIVLLNTLQYFIAYGDTSQKVYKKEVFKCINIIKQLKKKYAKT